MLLIIDTNVLNTIGVETHIADTNVPMTQMSATAKLASNTADANAGDG